MFISLGECKKDCDIDCTNAPKGPVCAKNGKTYESFCMLQKQSCGDDEDAIFECDGACPCDPAEVIEMDKDTVRQIQDARTAYQLRKHQNDYNELINKLRDGREREEHHESAIENKFTKDCSPSDMVDLPARLVDWFHVLRVNDRISEMEDQRIEREPVMIGQTFQEEKLRAIYSQLSCAERQTKGFEEKICLNPVKWMFNRLDADANGFLSTVELLEIEHIQNEQCIKPFFDKCDSNKDDKVGLSEFCKCLCVTPPCTNAVKHIPYLMIRGVPVPAKPDMFIPKCDDDGFFMPEQCHEDVCWCVGRHGTEISGTRNAKGPAHCRPYNTNKDMVKNQSKSKKE